MVQGTTSDAGKSILVTGLCRVLHRRGVRVAPFKPQNMALNSAVTSDGGEIGRAQALQAAAARVEPHTDMNPVLLKPSSDKRAQIIIQGHALQNMQAEDYHNYKPVAHHAVMESWQRLTDAYDAVMVEGAGSPAEINLREGDIANMGFAEAADCPVVLVADIDRGGVFAHLVGTLQLLSESEQARVVGFIINRFRGELALLQPGLDWLEQHTGKPVLGVLPYLHNLRLDAEDALSASQTLNTEITPFKVLVPVLPRISNHTDFDSLRYEAHVDLQYIGNDQPVPGADLIILPGSKNVRADRQWLRDNGWDEAIEKHLRYGGKLLGICGGYQMLGDLIDDPEGIEDAAGSIEGLGLIQARTTLLPGKTLEQTEASLRFGNTACKGYEIHCGRTEQDSSLESFLTLADGRKDGCISRDGQIAGTYLHGLLDEKAARAAILAWAGCTHSGGEDMDALREREIERLADCFEAHLDLAKLLPAWCAS